jgi:hypothetical protein
MASRLRVLGSLAVLTAIFTAGASCDLLSEATSFTICTDPETITIDTSQLGLTVNGAVIPVVDCSQQDLCSQAAQQVTCGGAGYQCEVVCGPSKTCEVDATAWHYEDVDLSQKIQNQLQSQAIEKVTLERVSYAVTQNTLNFDTPQLSLYLGSQAMTQPDNNSTLFGTMPPVPAGTKADGVLQPTPQGQSALNGFVRNYKTPFRILGEANLVFPSGAALPSGSLTATITTCFKVSPL